MCFFFKKIRRDPRIGPKQLMYAYTTRYRRIKVSVVIPSLLNLSKVSLVRVSSQTLCCVLKQGTLYPDKCLQMYSIQKLFDMTEQLLF